jgi:hypothetical protein
MSMAEEGQARRRQAAAEYDRAADELELAVRHLRTTAQHFRDGEVPRGCAHAWAAHGHAISAERIMEEMAVLHASRSIP